MVKKIKYPYKELTDLERRRIEVYKDRLKVDDNEIYVYYTTSNTVGIGYNIIVSLEKYNKKNNNFGMGAENITDIESLIDNI